MFRCPHCGQAQEIALTDNISVINVNETKDGHGLDHTYIAQQGTAPASWTYVDRKDEKGFKTAFLFFYPTGEVPCPSCQEISKLEDWMATWKDPLVSDDLETENLCHCGGELWMDQIKGTKQYAFICDKCGWVKPNSKVNGAQK